MFVLICERVFKVAIHSTEKFAARTTNRVQVCVSGPFKDFADAQQGMLKASVRTLVFLPKSGVMSSSLRN